MSKNWDMSLVCMECYYSKELCKSGKVYNWVPLIASVFNTMGWNLLIPLEFKAFYLFL